MTIYLLAAAFYAIPALIVALIAWDTIARQNRPPSASYRAYEGGRSGFTRTN